MWQIHKIHNTHRTTGETTTGLNTTTQKQDYWDGKQTKKNGVVRSKKIPWDAFIYADSIQHHRQHFWCMSDSDTKQLGILLTLFTHSTFISGCTTAFSHRTDDKEMRKITSQNIFFLAKDFCLDCVLLFFFFSFALSHFLLLLRVSLLFSLILILNFLVWYIFFTFGPLYFKKETKNCVSYSVWIFLFFVNFVWHFETLV